MSGLIDRRRKGRQTRVEHGGKVFIVSRPKHWQVLEMSQSGKDKQMDVLAKFVDGWENFTELDLVPGGDSTPAEFSTELFIDWVEDNPDFWSPLIAAINNEYTAFAQRQAEAEKK